MAALVVTGIINRSHDRCAFCFEEELKPGDLRLYGAPRYFDVIAIEAQISNPAHRYPLGGSELSPISDFSVIPVEVKFTDEDFTRIVRKIFEEGFHKKFGDNGVLIAREGDSYTFETNPHMIKIVFSLQKTKDGKSFVQAAFYKTHWASAFTKMYPTELDREIQYIKGQTDKNSLKQDFFRVMGGAGGSGRATVGFVPSNNQEEFIRQIEDSTRGALRPFMKGDVRPEPEIARKYSKILLESLKEGK